MTDVIFVQVIFGRLRASSYNSENKGNYNMNLQFIEVQKIKLECLKSFLSEFSFYFSYMKMNFRHVFFGLPGIECVDKEVLYLRWSEHGSYGNNKKCRKLTTIEKEIFSDCRADTSFSFKH